MVKQLTFQFTLNLNRRLATKPMSFYPHNIFFTGDVVEVLLGGRRAHIKDNFAYFEIIKYYDDKDKYYALDNQKVTFRYGLDDGIDDISYEPHELMLYARPFKNWVKFCAAVLFGICPFNNKQKPY